MSIAKRLATPTWKIADYMGAKNKAQVDYATLQKVITLSGLSADPAEIQADLAHQLQFLEVLLDVECDAKPLSRLVAPVVCPTDPNAAGPTPLAAREDWNPTRLAAKSKNGYYVVDKPLGIADA